MKIVRLPDRTGLFCRAEPDCERFDTGHGSLEEIQAAAGMRNGHESYVHGYTHRTHDEETVQWSKGPVNYRKRHPI